MENFMSKNQIFSRRACCFIGHREVKDVTKTYLQAKNCIEELIVKEKMKTFYFGSKSKFDELCLKIVTDLKDIYSELVRVYVRAEYEYIGKEYTSYLLHSYDKTYYAKKAQNANKLVYIKRNEEMIDNSRICIFYYDKKHRTRSGTAIAFDYAQKLGKEIKLLLP